MEKKSGRGGYRKGSGRKPGKTRIAKNIYLPEALWEQIDIMAKRESISRSAWMENAANNGFPENAEEIIRKFHEEKGDFYKYGTDK